MKTITLGLAVLFSVFANGQVPKPVKDVVTAAQIEFQELAIDLPFEKVYYGWRERVRDNYKNATRFVAEAATLVDREPKRAADLLDSALSLYRQCGLLLPFYEIDKTRVDEVMSRYLQAEDSLQQAVRTLSGMQQPIPNPTPTSYWRQGNLTWLALNEVLGYSEAKSRCGQLKFDKTKDWQLPTFRSLASSFRDLKNPATNTVFGKAAAEFGEVWALDQHQPEDVYYYIDFKREKSGITTPSARLETVCVGVATNR